MPKSLSNRRLTWYLGLALVAAGLCLRAVETFELSPEATRVAASWFGPPAETPHGLVRQMAIDTLEPRHRVTPPRWLGYAALSAGSVLAALGWRKG